MCSQYSTRTFLNALKLFEILYTQRSSELAKALKETSLAIEEIAKVENFVKKASKTMVTMYSDTNKKKSLLVKQQKEWKQKSKIFNLNKDNLVSMQEHFNEKSNELKEKFHFLDKSLQEIIKHFKTATQAIYNISSELLVQLRTTKKPSKILMVIMDIVLLVMRKDIYRGEKVFITNNVTGKKNDVAEDNNLTEITRMNYSWKLSLTFMRKRNFLDTLKFAKHMYLNPETVDLLDPYFYQIHSTAMDPDEKVAPLLQWAMNIEK